MKKLLILLAFTLSFVACNESTIDTDEAIPTNKLDAVLSLDDEADTAAFRDTTNK